MPEAKKVFKSSFTHVTPSFYKLQCSSKSALVSISMGGTQKNPKKSPLRRRAACLTDSYQQNSSVFKKQQLCTPP